MKVRNLLLFLIFSFVSSVARASDSITYSIASRMIDTTERFSLGLFDAIAAAYKPLYVSIAIIGLTLLMIKYIWTGVTPMREMVSFLLSMQISSFFAFDASLFKAVVYDNFFDTLYRLNQFIIASSATEMTEIGNIGFNSIEGMFRTVDNSLMFIANFAWDVWQQNSNFLSSTVLFFEALIVYLLYLFIGVYFLVIFTVAILGAHMMIILMPITLSLYPFKKFRQYTSNSIMGMIYYALVTMFVCVSISLVVFITNDLVVQANQLAAEAEANGGDIVFSSDFLTGSIMIGLISIFTIKIAPEFASRILNAASTQVGSVFPMIIAGGITAAKMAYSVDRSVVGAVSSGVNSAKSVSSKVASYTSKGVDMYRQYNKSEPPNWKGGHY